MVGLGSFSGPLNELWGSYLFALASGVGALGMSTTLTILMKLFVAMVNKFITIVEF